MSILNAKGVQLNVVERGRGTPLVLVHGYPLDHSMWRGQTEGVADSCRLIAPAMRGFGASAGTVGSAAALRGMAERPDVTDELGKINVPALLICGEHDGISPPSEMRQIADHMPHARFVEIAGAGHMSPLEQPGAVNAAIREFVGK